jgi:MarR family transcriptional regulator, transcriptional regulator for hemolysin
MRKKTIVELDSVLMYQMYRLGRLLRNYLQQFLDVDGSAFTPEQFFLLYRLYMKDGQTQRQLADRDLNDHPNITRLIDRLEEKGYVRREPAADDRRTYNIHISDKGKGLAARMIPVIAREREKLLRGITAEEEKVVKNLLRKMEKNMNG